MYKDTCMDHIGPTRVLETVRSLYKLVCLHGGLQSSNCTGMRAVDCAAPHMLHLALPLTVPLAVLLQFGTKVWAAEVCSAALAKRSGTRCYCVYHRNL
jgi:hypothetical protein